MRASCTFNLHVCKFPGTIHRVIVPVETHDRGDVRFFSPVSRAICLDTTDVRRPNNQRRKPSRPLLKKKKKNNLTWPVRKNRRTLHVEQTRRNCTLVRIVFPLEPYGNLDVQRKFQSLSFGLVPRLHRLANVR